MKENESALYSHYIIDGVRQEMTPAELLDECMEYEDTEAPSSDMFGTFDDIIDESTDPPVSAFAYDRSRNEEYAAMTAEASGTERAFPMLYPEHFTRLHIAEALTSRLWSKGHFRLYINLYLIDTVDICLHRILNSDNVNILCIKLTKGCVKCS